MRIIDDELSISRILNVKKSTIPISEGNCRKRYSSCFVYVLSGSACYYFSGKKAAVSEGNIIFLAKNSTYDIRVTEPGFRFYFIDFDFSGDVQLESEVLKQEKLKTLENIFIKLHFFWTSGNFADKVYCKSLLYNVYSSIIRECSFEYVPNSKRKKIEHALDHMRQNFADPDISIEALSKNCSISEVHFRRLFYQIYHTTPMKYITSLRISKAKELLTSTETKMRDISQACGFNNPYYFSKVFRENTSLTPTEYRAAFKQQY